MSVIVVGDDGPSEIYIKNKLNKCKQVGIKFKKYVFSKSVEQQKILDLIYKLNEDDEVDAILVQMPLPSQIDKFKVIESINFKKDVDCFTSVNFGKAAIGVSNFWPCTASGIIHLLKKNKIKISGKKCVVVGRSNIVGKPVSMALLSNDGTVTTCHSKTENLIDICKTADILVSASGHAKIIKKNMVKKGCVVIDVGINRENSKLCGDVDFENVREIASYITPVPGGVGPMTVAFLLKNTLTLFENKSRPSSWLENINFL